jgi:para-nitrobenzyl esterase
MIANTKTGAVRGAVNDGVAAFKGIPYGDDTSGTGRFLPPRPPLAWSGVRDCLEYGPSCPQITTGQMTGQDLPAEIEPLVGVWNHERNVGEDCLVLNVWTPAASGAGRPVLVWLHGGAFAVGSASWPLYDFSNLARNNDVVVIGLNHRLGILGFLELSHLGEEFADSGNVGMLDIVAALAWVRDNIAAFGGDPGNVTVFGESGGGAKVNTLLAMPAAQGLFRNAFVMSGTRLRAKTFDTARALTDTTLDTLGVHRDVGLLHKLDADALVQAQLALPPAGSAAPRFRTAFEPTLGPSLPRHPLDAIRGGSGAQVNVVVGCTTHEMLSFVTTPDLWVADDESLRERIHTFLGAAADRVIAEYRQARPGESMLSLYVLIASDHAMRVPHIRLADALLDGGSPQPHVYLFAFGGPGPDGVVRSGHGSDMTYFFDNIKQAPVFDGPHAAPLVRALSGALIALARSGDPNHEGIPDWPGYSTAHRPTMIFDVESRLATDPMGAERRIWDGIEGLGLM